MGIKIGPKESMKILFATGEKSTRGGHRVLTVLIKELNKRGHKATVVLIAGQEHADDAGLQKLWRGVPTINLRIGKFETSDEKDWAKIQAVAAYLQKHAHEYDRLVMDSWHMSYAAMLAGVEKHACQLVQSYPAFKPEDSTKIWRAAYFDVLPRVPMQRIAVSKYLAGELQKTYRQKALVVEPFIDDAYFKTNFEYRNAKPIKLIATASTWKPKIKGLDFLLDTLSLFHGYPFELTLVSGEPLERSFAKLPFTVRTTSAATPMEMSQLLANHDVYLSVSSNETFHMSLVEAMAVGMPVVALDSGGNRDYIRAGKNAFLAKTQKEFLQGLKVLEHVAIRSRMGHTAQKTVQKYSLERMADGFMSAMKII